MKRPGRGMRLFWRSFLIITLLLSLSLMASYQFFLWASTKLRVEQLADQVASEVRLSKMGLFYAADGERRLQFLESFVFSHEKISIFQFEKHHVIKPLPDNRFYRMFAVAMRERLSPDTKLASSVEGNEGLWVSFELDDAGAFWVKVPLVQLNHVSVLEWGTWGVIAMLLSMAGALAIGKFLNKPFARLTHAAQTISEGKLPNRLHESGPLEVRLLTRSFNQMLQELTRLEDDRALILAGISHDLRTPLTRLRLEIELSVFDEMTRDAMSADIDQMESIVTQFLDYAKIRRDETTFVRVNLRSVIEDALYPYIAQMQEGDTSLQLSVHFLTTEAWVNINVVEIQRVITNLIENAKKYGRDQDEICRVDLTLQMNLGVVELIVRDYGQGVPEAQLEMLKRPFYRLDKARSQAGSSGLGLAIVDRIIQRMNGEFVLQLAQPSGLQVVIRLPLVSELVVA